MNQTVRAIADLLAEEAVLLGLAAADKASLLAALAQSVTRPVGLTAQAVEKALLAREAMGSTGLGAGFALPHARLPGLVRFHALFARLSAPIAFDAIDGAPVDLVFLLLLPAEDRATALAALAAIARRMRLPGIAAALRAAPDARAAHAILAGQPPA
ncbi:MAG: PTS sugar transporter subunit IIA [Rhodospirillales bacterium]|nr:PTS sugar transporter subunit IIA [Rhodospirillales bacterium]